MSAENLSLYPDPVRAIELLKSPDTIERDIRQVFVDCVELLPWLSFLCKKYKILISFYAFPFLLLDMFESWEALRVTVQEFLRR